MRAISIFWKKLKTFVGSVWFISTFVGSVWFISSRFSSTESTMKEKYKKYKRLKTISLFVNDIWNKSYMNCGNEMKMKKWSSQRTQFMQLRKEAWKKIQDLTGFEPVTSRYRWDALPTELWSHWRREQVNCRFSYIINTHFFLGNIWTHNWPANNNNNNNNANNRGKLFPRSPFSNSCKGCYEVVWSRQLLLLKERRSYTYALIAVVNGCLACTCS